MRPIADRIADKFIGRAVHLARFEAGLQRKAIAQLRKVEAELVADLAKVDPTGPTYTKWQRARLEALLATTRETIRRGFRAMREKHERQMTGLAQTEANTVPKAVADVVGADVLSVSVSEAQLAQVVTTTMIEGAPAADWWKRQEDSVHKAFSDQMQLGYLRGETVQQLIGRVRGTKAGGYTDGIMAATRRNAQALVRTSVQGISNGARQAVYEANTDVVNGMQALATLDTRTTPICIARDGSAWDIATKDPLPASPRQEPWPGYPPWHWNCRSTIIPVLRPLADMLEAVGAKKAAALAQLPEGTRASMNGQVAASMRFPQWLETQPEAVQREVLGQGKWEMWKAGKLDLADLIDQRGRPLTLEQLQAKYGGGSGGPAPVSAPPAARPPARPTATPAKPPQQYAQWDDAPITEKEAPLLQEIVDTWAKVQAAEGDDAAELAAISEHSAASKAYWDATGKIPPAASKHGQVQAAINDFHQSAMAPSVAVARSSKASVKIPIHATLDAATKAWEQALQEESDAMAKGEPWAVITAKSKATQAAWNSLKTLQAAQKAGEQVAPPPSAVDVGPAIEAAEAARGHAAVVAAQEGATPHRVAVAQAQADEALRQVHDAVQAAQDPAPAAAVGDFVGVPTGSRKAKWQQLPSLDPEVAQRPWETEPTWQLGPGEHWFDRRYGAVLMDNSGRILLREPKGHFDGYVWTFPKGGVSKSDVSAGEVALREVAEETGFKGDLVGIVPGSFGSGKNATNMFLMRVKSVDLRLMDKETSRTRWVTAEEAVALIEQTKNHSGRRRDLEILDAAIKARKTLLAKKAKAETPPAPDWPSVQALNRLEHVRDLGGSTGAVLMRDPDTMREYVLKRGASPEHLREEAYALAAYRAAGVLVPDSRLYETAGGPVQLSAYVPNAVELGKIAGARLNVATTQLRRHFVVDALLADYDVIGMNSDNVLVGSDGRAWRIDVGGSLRYRAQGLLKKTTGEKSWGGKVAELDTLRDPKTNPQAARVFGSITQAEIESQIRDVLRRRQAILEALPAELRGVVGQRMDHLATMVTEQVFSAEFAARVAKSRVAGEAHLGDKDLVEDTQVLFWQENDSAGRPVTRVRLKLTPAGDAKVKEALAEEFKRAGRGAATAGVDPRWHPKDQFFEAIEAAAKTVNHHQKDGQYNNAKLAELNTAVSMLQKLLNQPDAKDMAAYYLQAAAAIQDAHAAKGNVAKIEKYLTPQPKSTTPDTPATLSRFTVTRGPKNFFVKVKKKGIATATGKQNRLSGMTDAFTIHDGDVAVELVASDSKSVPFAFRGLVEATLPGEATAETLNRFGDIMREVGVDLTPVSDTYKELRYLAHITRLVAHGRKPHLIKELDLYMEGAVDEERKLEAVRRLATEATGVDASMAKPFIDGSANPWGGGWRVWYRYDIPPEQMELEMAGYVVVHQAGADLPGFIESVLDGGGQITPTLERLRVGVDLSTSRGAFDSIDTDATTGGGSYFFTRIKEANETSDLTGFVFKSSVLSRMDAFSFNRDVFGDIRPEGENQHVGDPWKARNRTPAEFRAASRSSGNETDFKNAMGMFSEVGEIRARSALEKAQIIKILENHGFKKWIDGRSLSQVVGVRSRR